MGKKYLKDADPVSRFWSYVEKTEDCWLWLGAPNKKGYGHAYLGLNAAGRTHFTRAHRFSYLLNVGPIPDGHDVHHTCRTRLCVRPDHLKTVEHAEHTRHHKLNRPH